MRTNRPLPAPVDLLLVGAGVMSATLAALAKTLMPGLRVEVAERLGECALESSDPWNNAGTGHAGLCEMNYTPEAADGTVDPAKAIKIHAQFEVSKQFWAHLVGTGALGPPRSFIHPVPHLSFVRGGKDIEFLRKRHAALAAHHTFADMAYSESREELRAWMPLVMEGRGDEERLAATRVAGGTDVDFGAITRHLFAHLSRRSGVRIRTNADAVDLARRGDLWLVTLRDTETGRRETILARRVFLGAGGGALPLLQRSGIPEGAGYGGFPVGGLWLRSDDEAAASRHAAKVYSLAAVGAPPMSVPHLDTRVVAGRRTLLFGPFAGFSTRFLKNGSLLDLPLSIRPGNLVPMLSVARDNMDLIRYLIGEVLQCDDERMGTLRDFHPNARPRDWRLEVAGQRVQIIKRDPMRGGKLEFGTEVIVSADGSLSALLGASPGASVAVSAMLDLIARSFPAEWASRGVRRGLARIIPAGAADLAADPALYRRVREASDRALALSHDEAKEGKRTFAPFLDRSGGGG